MRISLIVPLFNEEQATHLFYRAVRQEPSLQDHEVEIVFINDGSTDGTAEQAAALAQVDEQVLLINFSRNFGKEAALTAGLDLVREGAAMILDADGQDPPELVPQFVARWREGHDNVYGTRLARDGEAWIKRATAAIFYRVMGRLSRTPIPADTGDFRLLSPRALSALREMRERHRFMKGLFSWVGFKRVAVPYHRHARVAGTSKFSLWRLWNFALEGITGFSTVPLRAATYLGLATAAVAFVFGNEGKGVSAPVLAACDRRVRIPMPGHAESLNVAMAVQVVAYLVAEVAQGQQVRFDMVVVHQMIP